MLKRLTHHFPHYFKQRLGRQLEELYATVGIQDFALAMMILFEPVYLYKLGNSVSYIAWYYAIVYGVYILFIPLGGKIVARYGPQRAIATSTFFLVLYYITLLSIGHWSPLFWIAPIIMAMQKMLYWPGYHADFMSASSVSERGKEYSALYALTTIMYIVGPLIGGTIVKFFGFNALFILGAILIFASNVPLFIDRPVHTPLPFSFWECFRLPFSRKHRRSMLAYLGFGEQLLAMYIWPIFLYITFKTVFNMGSVAALATLVTATITLMIGRLVDGGKWKATFRSGAVLAAANWFARLFLKWPSAVFASDTAGRISWNLTFVTSTEVAYQRADAEQEPIRRAILLEQGLSYGKLAIAVLLAIFAGFCPPFAATFVLGALFSLLYFVFR